MNKNRLTSEQVLNLPFGTIINIAYKNGWNNGSYYAVVYSNKIGYEDGMTDDLRTIAEQVFNNQCNVYKVK